MKKIGAGAERQNENVETRAPKIYQSDEKDKSINWQFIPVH